MQILGETSQAAVRVSRAQDEAVGLAAETAAVAPPSMRRYACRLAGATGLDVAGCATDTIVL